MNTFFQNINKLRLIVINILFILFVVIVFGTCVASTFLSALFNDSTNGNKKASVLIINPSGAITEDSYFADSESYFFDMTEALRLSITDEKITTILLDLSSSSSISFSQIEELHSLIKQNKDSGKNIVAFAYQYNQTNYYLASIAHTIFVEESGSVEFDGLVSKSLFFANSFDKFMIDVDVFKVGNAKSGAEVFVDTKFSNESRANMQKTLNQLWQIFLTNVGENRNFEAPYSELTQYQKEYLSNIEKAFASGTIENNLYSSIAYNAKLVDSIVEVPSFYEYEDLLKLLSLSENYINYKDYIPLRSYSATAKIAVVTLEGSITDFEEPTKGYVIPSLFKYNLDNAFEDNNVKGIVVRVNSPGGSVGASQALYEAIAEGIKKHEKPVTISFGSVAASGGYWLSMQDKELSVPIFASSTTLTGSIGVYAILPNFSRALEHYLSISIDSVASKDAVNSPSIIEPLSPQNKRQLQNSVNYIFARFKNLVMDSRGISEKEFNQVAGGYVFTGEEALKLNLVDSIGGLYDAIDEVAERAKVRKYNIDFQKRYKTTFEKFSEELMNEIVPYSISNELFSVLQDEGFYPYIYLKDEKDLFAICPYSF